MKIRSRLTLQYTAMTAVIFLVSMLSISIWSEHDRSESFYRNLKREAVTKAHLFLSGKMDAESMHSVYSNNSNFIDEVEVAVYTDDFTMVYHDAIQSDIVKETSGMIDEILSDGPISFRIGRYQAIGMVYAYDGKDYILTAAAYDGYGHSNMATLNRILLLISLLGLSILCFVGHGLAGLALSPVKLIVKKMEGISSSNIGERLPVGRNKDELDELSMTFNALLNDLEKAFQSQKMFVSNVSHELRTPMAALVADTEITLLKPRDNEKYVTSLNNVLIDARKVIHLIDGLLNMAKADYNPSQIKMVEVRLDEVLMDARSTVISAHPEYHVDIVFEAEAEDDSVITVVGNPYLLTTAFVNLIENNCKFSENRTSIVQIGYSGDQAVVRLSDNGIGIAEENIADLFKPFYRGGNAGYAPGHGIGLALAAKIMSLHHGLIKVNSKVQEGTTFIVGLPHV